MWEYQRDAGFFYNADTGDVMTLADMEEYVDELIQEGMDDAEDLLAEYLDQDPPQVDEFKREFSALLVALFTSLAILGIGGVQHYTDAQREAVEARLDRQFRHLDAFVEQLRAGTAVHTLGRVRMYVNSSRQAYWMTREDFERGLGHTEARWVTVGDEGVCISCTEAEDLGWQPLGFFAEAGSGIVIRNPTTMCEGLTSCRCRKEYR